MVVPVVLAMTLNALVGLAEAQAPARPRVDRGVTVTASEGRVLYVDTRYVSPGQYWFAVRVTVARDPKASPDDRVMFSWIGFQFVAEDGTIYRSVPTVLPGVEPCQVWEQRYLLPGTAATCDLIFQVPSNVTRGTVEAMTPRVPPVPITIRE